MLKPDVATDIIPAVVAPVGHSQAAPGLRGSLTTLDIALATLAYAGPLAGTAGYAALIIGMGNGLGTPLAFLALMLVLATFAVGYGAMTRHVPYPGAFYAYITAGLGRAIGLGSAFLILGCYFAVGVGVYGWAGLATKAFVVQLGGPPIDWWVYALVLWAIVGTLSYFHIALSAKVLGVFLILECLVAFVFDALVMFHGGAEGISLEPFTWSAFTSGHLGIALLFAAGLFTGFEATAIYREETRNPEKAIPRATLLVVLFIGIFYALTSWALITGLGTSSAVRIASAEPAAAFYNVARRFGGQLFCDVAAGLVVTSMFAATLSVQNVTTRYVYSLAVDRVFPTSLGIAHEKHHSPHRASVAVSLIYLVLTASMIAAGLSGETIYAWFAGWGAFSILCAMAITSIATAVYFQREKVSSNFWQVTFAPIAATIGLCSAVVLGVQNFPALIGGSSLLANTMLLVTALTFVVGFAYARWLKWRHPATYNRIGRQSAS